MPLTPEQETLMERGLALVGHCPICRDTYFYGELPMESSEVNKALRRAKCPNGHNHVIYMGPHKPPPKNFKVSILWGRVSEPGDEAKTYAFETQAELDAFQQGVDAAIGWLEYRESEEGHVYSEKDL